MAERAIPWCTVSVAIETRCRDPHSRRAILRQSDRLGRAHLRAFRLACELGGNAMRIAVPATFAILALATPVQAGETLSAAAYDRNKDGILDETEALVWRLHAQDPVLAKDDRK